IGNARFEQHDTTPHALGCVSNDAPKREIALPALESNCFSPWLGPALYGAVYPGHEDAYRESFETRSGKIVFGSNEFWESQFDNDPFSSPLNLTGIGVRGFRIERAAEFARLKVVVVDSVSSLCLFWC